MSDRKDPIVRLTSPAQIDAYITAVKALVIPVDHSTRILMAKEQLGQDMRVWGCIDHVIGCATFWYGSPYSERQIECNSIRHLIACAKRSLGVTLAEAEECP